MTIFAKILAGELPCDSVYEDEQVLAFRDINPAAPTHILVIPKKPLAKLSDMDTADEPMIGHLMRVATLVGKQEGPRRLPGRDQQRRRRRTDRLPPARPRDWRA